MEQNETNWGLRRFLKLLNFLFIPLFNLFYSLYTITISLFVNIGTLQLVTNVPHELYIILLNAHHHVVDCVFAIGVNQCS